MSRGRRKSLGSASRRKGSMLPPVSAGFRKWREQFNPLRGLTIQRAVSLLEAAQRGEYADYQWTCFLMERRFAELMALIARRTSAVLEMDWGIKTVAGLEGEEAALAERQAARLREVYDGIGNFYEALEVLEMAVFRGVAFCEKVVNGDGDVVELRPVDAWNLVRDGLARRWKYNPEAAAVTFDSLGGEELPLERFVWRVVERPINEMALVLFLRANAARKNWDAFLEIYGVPGGVVVAPPEVSPEQMPEFQRSGLELSQGGSGVLPYGASYTANDGPRGMEPFTGYLKAVSEALVLAGTGGKLTMLNDAVGMGGSQSETHADAFRAIAAGDARQISEVLQKQVDAEVLERDFAGKPVLAYFEMSFREEVDAGKVVADAVSLAGAGYRMDVEELGEKTGYVLEEKKDEVGSRKDEGERSLEGRLRAVAEADEGDLERAVAVLNREFPAVGAVLGNGTYGTDGTVGVLVNGNKNHDPQDGRFTFGFPDGEEPGRKKIEEATKELREGHTETDGEGRKVRFGAEMLEKLKDKPDRLELLGWGYDTVRTGKAVVLKVKGEDRTHYGKIYQGKDKARGFMVIVDTHDGYAFNMHIAKPSQVIRKMGNRANTGEQPPAGVLQAIAAASGLPGWVHDNMEMQEVKG